MTPSQAPVSDEIPLDAQIAYVKTWLELCSLLGRDVDRPKLEAILCSLESLKTVRADSVAWLVKQWHRDPIEACP